MTSKFKEAREKAGYTIEEVSDILKIRKQYIINLEEGDFTNIPGKVYVKGYTKIYSDFLGLEFEDEKENQDHNPTVLKDKSSSKEYKAKRRIVTLVSFVLLIIVIVIYAVYKDNCISFDDNNDDLIDNTDENNKTEHNQPY
jgi:cytoskeletal protein RodZ